MHTRLLGLRALNAWHQRARGAAILERRHSLVSTLRNSSLGLVVKEPPGCDFKWASKGALRMGLEEEAAWIRAQVGAIVGWRGRGNPYPDEVRRRAIGYFLLDASKEFHRPRFVWNWESACRHCGAGRRQIRSGTSRRTRASSVWQSSMYPRQNRKSSLSFAALEVFTSKGSISTHSPNSFGGCRDWFDATNCRLCVSRVCRYAQSIRCIDGARGASASSRRHVW